VFIIYRFDCISIISSRSDLLVKETVESGENPLTCRKSLIHFYHMLYQVLWCLNPLSTNYSHRIHFVISNLKKCILLRFCIFSGVPEGEPASGLIVLEISVKIRLRQFKISRCTRDHVFMSIFSVFHVSRFRKKAIHVSRLDPFQTQIKLRPQQPRS
jgi:hypothetical protein